MNNKRYYPSTELLPEEELSREEALQRDWYVAAILDDEGDALQAEIYQGEVLQHLVYHRDSFEGVAASHQQQYAGVPFEVMLPLEPMGAVARGRVGQFDEAGKLEAIEEIYLSVEEGLVVAEHQLNGEEQLLERRVYTYDNAGALEVIQTYDGEDTLLSEEFPDA